MVHEETLHSTNRPACVAKAVPASLRACRDWIDVELWLRSHSSLCLIRDAALTAAVPCMGIVAAAHLLSLLIG